jgi:hypothetical protein
MDKPVSEFGHVSQFHSKVCIDNIMLFEHFERIRIILRCPETFCRNNVIGNVQATLDADL